MWFRRLLRGIVALVCIVPVVMGHGYLAEPAARNTDRTTNYCPHCLSGGGVGSVFEGGRNYPNGKYGICGDPPGPNPMHEGGGDFQRLNGGLRMTYYAQGSAITMKVTITANHGGFFQFKLCKVPDALASSATSAERATVTQACFDRQILGLQTGNAYFLDPTATPPFTVTIRGTLPAGLTCKRCVLQWHYVSANSCNPPGLPRKWWVSENMGTCGKVGNPEEFWNCADIGIVSRGTQVPPPKNTGKMIGMATGGAADGAGGGAGFGYGTIDGTGSSYPSTNTGGSPTSSGDSPLAPSSPTGTVGDISSGHNGDAVLGGVFMGTVGGAAVGIPLSFKSPMLGVVLGGVICAAVTIIAYMMRRRKSSFGPYYGRRWHTHHRRHYHRHPRHHPRHLPIPVRQPVLDLPAPQRRPLQLAQYAYVPATVPRISTRRAFMHQNEL